MERERIESEGKKRKGIKLKERNKMVRSKGKKSEGIGMKRMEKG